MNIDSYKQQGIEIFKLWGSQDKMELRIEMRFSF